MMRNENEWYVGYIGPWNPIQPPGGVAPSRADLALARYLEKKAADSAEIEEQQPEQRSFGSAFVELCRVCASLLIPLRGL